METPQWSKSAAWDEAEFLALEMENVSSGSIMFDDGAIRAHIVLKLTVASADSDEKEIRIMFVEGLCPVFEVGANLIRAYGIAEYETAATRARRASEN